MAKLQIVWTGGPTIHKISHEIKSGLYMVRCMGERVAFTIVKGHNPLTLAPTLENTLDETGKTFVFAADDHLPTRLETNWAYPGEALVSFNPLLHVASGRHPVVENDKLVIVASRDSTQPRKSKRSYGLVRHPV